MKKSQELIGKISKNKTLVFAEKQDGVKTYRRASFRKASGDGFLYNDGLGEKLINRKYALINIQSHLSNHQEYSLE